MKILHIGNTDIYGDKFNGFDLGKKLKLNGIESECAVWEKYSNDKSVWNISNFKGNLIINRKISNLEKRLSIQSLLYINSLTLPFNKRFRKADLVHYHLIQAGFFSIATLPILTRIKPSIWTIHDPWAMTGHCIYPYDCERWKIGCGKCPYLKTHIPMNKDHTALMWKIKKFVYKKSKLDIVVASKYMLDMAKKSPLLSNFELHHIPFGLDINLYYPTNTDEAKKKLNISTDKFVIAFRSTNNEFKGLDIIKKVLRKLKTYKKICLLTFHDKDLLKEFKGKFEIVELGWVKDQKRMVTAYNASDIFLMPSRQEAFGLMAVEAMLCAKPVISFLGTSLPEITFAPNGGISVPMGDIDALIKEILNLINNPGKRKELGDNARRIASKFYDEKIYIKRMIELYTNKIKKS